MADRARVDIVVPVHNEERVLPDSITRLHAFLSEEFPFDWRIVIADNASTDGTADGGRRARRTVRRRRGDPGRPEGQGPGAAGGVDGLDGGRGGVHGRRPLDRAHRTAAARRAAGVGALRPGRRLAAERRVDGRPRAEAGAHLTDATTSSCAALFAVRFRDAQCGFKALRTDVAQRLLPAVQDEEWFFDTELLLLAEQQRIAHPRGARRLGRRSGQPGGRRTDGVGRPPRGASGALVVHARRRAGRSRAAGTTAARRRLRAADGFVRRSSGRSRRRSHSSCSWPSATSSARSGPTWSPSRRRSVGNSWAQRRWTFRRRGPAGRWWHVAGTAALYLGTLALSTAGLALVEGNRSAEVAVLLVTWGLAGLIRFVLLRSWVYRRPSTTSADPGRRRPERDRPAAVVTTSETAAKSPSPCNRSNRDGQPASGKGRSSRTTHTMIAPMDGDDAQRHQAGKAGPAEADDEHGGRRRGDQRPTPSDEQGGGDDPRDRGDPPGSHRHRGFTGGEAGGGHRRRRDGAPAIEQDESDRRRATPRRSARGRR